VFLPNWIGDAVMATPALRALRKHFRGATLVGVQKPYVSGVLEGGDWFDRVLLADPGSWSRGLAMTAWKLRRPGTARAVVSPTSSPPARVARRGGCARRVGYARYGRRPLLTDALMPEREANGRLRVSPAVDAYNRLAEHVGCPRPGYE